MMEVYSTGQVAKMLGVSFNKLRGAMQCGAPRPASKSGDRYVYTQADVKNLFDYFAAKGVAVTAPAFIESLEIPSTSTP